MISAPVEKGEKMARTDAEKLIEQEVFTGDLRITLDDINYKPVGMMEVVRCEDCIFSKRDMDVHPDPKIFNKDRWCELYGRKSPDWFCADGKRREDAENHLQRSPK